MLNEPIDTWPPAPLRQRAHDVSADEGKCGDGPIQIPHLHVTTIHKMLSRANSFVVVTAIRKDTNIAKVTVFTC